MAGVADRLERLERLRGLLAGGAPAVTADLAAEIGVSVRTVARDLVLLRTEGVAIDADRGRGGGIRLARGEGGGRVNLSADEAIDLLIALAVAESAQTPLLSGKLRGVRQKISVTFAPAMREHIRALRRRILVGGAASAAVRASYRADLCASAGVIRAAFFEQRLLALRYADEHGRKTEREIEPQFLYLNVPAWYVLGWDHLRAGVRFFRIDRIAAAEALQRRFRLRAAGPFLSAAERGVATL